MKQKIFTFLLIAAAGLTACKKLDNQPDIREYDKQQIEQYISGNGLNDFIQDPTPDGTGTTGMYYKILTPGSGDSIKYADKISIVYTLKSFDGKYTSSDTISNHIEEYLGHLTADNLPKGLQLAIHNLLQYRGGSMRVLIPSRLAYGVNGFGSGSITNVNTRIAGNQCLDYYVHVIGDQPAYDDIVINNYMAANSLKGYTKDALGYYYKIITPGTGAAGEISEFSTVTATYSGALLNGVAFDESSKTTATTLTPYNLIDGVKDALIKHAVTGTSISILIPSPLGYGTAAQNSIPSNSALRFEFQVTKVE
ncbi:FKBP-type peptidyl-prolyl cis-trans isomerase FkpA [Mucilaginibacter sp. UYP25]|uniref:FKBP-type peptidyl-prolyl cis-trans isomerase n=1 Tax=unclassified Mucilaginibacter TaxID=2617802 RepID=UPI003395E1A9